VEGQNVAIEFRYAVGQYERLPALATDLVSLRVSSEIKASIDGRLINDQQVRIESRPRAAFLFAWLVSAMSHLGRTDLAQCPS
jgi:hypothetical protein